MSYAPNRIIVALLSVVFLCHTISAQDLASDSPKFQVNKAFPSLAVTKESLKVVQGLSDFKFQPKDRNLSFDPAWVKTYQKVEVSTTHSGKVIKSYGANDKLTEEQKSHILSADAGSEISVYVEYIPDNNLMNNKTQNLSFSFSVDPDTDAQYLDGEAALLSYLKAKVIDLIPDGTFKGYDLTAVKFTINEEGEVTNVHMFDDAYLKTNSPKVDSMLLDAVREMSCGTPAEYADGTKVAQEFVLTVGNTENCIVNLLNIQ